MTTNSAAATSLLFAGPGAVAALAGGLTAHAGGRQLKVSSVGLEDSTDLPLARRLLQEVGAGLPAATHASLSELQGESFDLVVTLGGGARQLSSSTTEGGDGATPADQSPLVSGLPLLLHWSVDPQLVAGEEGLRRLREQLTRRVEALLDQGFLGALLRQRRHWEGLLDTLQDGILAHDLNRRIYLFNREAERITGLTRQQVLGLDCHEVFPPDGLCGSQCKFCSPTAPGPQRASWETVFTARDGVDRRLKMSVSPLQLQADQPWGVIISMHDITEVSDLRHRLRTERSFHGMVAASRPMQELFSATRQISTSDYPVLITGDSGTGKELLAGAIHQESRRRDGPFVPINCGALPDNILESELFGHVRGAFTGAIRNKKGRFEMAHGGTLFLDEVGELSPRFQVKLLRVLQEKRFEMVGGERTIEVDVRVISATNQELRKLIAEGTFREDLYYRLCVFPLQLPALSGRREDIPLIVEHALQKVRQETDSRVEAVSSEAMEALLSYHWPGNVRELINAIQYASVLCGSGEIHPSNLPPEVFRGAAESPVSPGVSPPARAERKRKLDREAVRAALRGAGGNKVKAAKILGVGRATLYRFLKDHPLER